jgi:eukaryotic-like serine/threonine-protein kinase
MSPEQWAQVEHQFAALKEMPVAERAAALGCLTDPAIRAEVASLLEFDGTVTAERNPIAGVIGAMAASTAAAAPFERFGPWRTTGILGRGGMGAVHHAVREDQFRQEAAVKVLHHGLDSEFALARFRYERQILATLEHPNVTRLIDGGELPATPGQAARPWLVLEFVKGKPITEHCRDHSLNVEAPLRLFRQVCETVQYAHTRSW